MAPWSHWQRFLKHRWSSIRWGRHSLPPEALQRLAQQVQTYEAGHSGEIRICIEAGLPLAALRQHSSARQRAIALFGQLQVWDTVDNNGVLIYLLLADQAIEIVADRGLQARLPATFWPQLMQQLQPPLHNRAYETSLSLGIELLGQALRQHFALAPGQARPNQLPDAPVLL